jgi:hypothetical protein
MANSDLGFKQATREHVLAVTRNFVSQPRISKCSKHMLYFFREKSVNYCKKCSSAMGESTAWGLKGGHVIKFLL